MKIKKILAAIAACAMTVAAVSVSASALADNQTAYQFGGAQVSWGWDADDDGDDDSSGGVNGDTWLGALDGGSGTIKIPAKSGDKVEIICLSWDSITDTPIFTATYDGTTYDCYYNQPVVINVADAASSISVDIAWCNTEADTDGSYNDWCGAGVIVTAGGADTAEVAEAPAANETAAETTTTAPATGNVPAAAMLSVMAVAGAAAVATKKRK